MVIRAQLTILCLFGQASFLAAQIVPAKAYVIQTVAGSDSAGDGGSALAAQFSQMEGIAVDSRGTIYVADADDSRVRKITTDGVIQTVAGTGIAGFRGDGGAATAALLNHPYGIAVDASGNLYIADLGNARVRRVALDGTIATVAGGGLIVPGGNGDGSPAVNAQLLLPRNVAVDSGGTLYISDFGAHRVYQVTAFGTLTTVAGTGNGGLSGDGSLAQSAQLRSPAGLACDANGVLFIADSGNNRIRKVDHGIITTMSVITGPTGVAAGPTGTLYVASASYFGTTSKAFAGVAPVRDVAVDRAGNAYVTNGQFLRKVTSIGAISTVAGSGGSRYFGGDNGPADAARLHAPAGIALDDAGNSYIADTANHRIRKITPAGSISTIAGTGEAGSKGDNAAATLAQLNGPRSVAVDSFHNIYVADTGNNAVRKITAAGRITTVTTQLNAPEYVAVGPDGAIYIADAGNNRVVKITPAGAISTITQSIKPVALTFDAAGNLLVVAEGRISKIEPTGVVTMLIDGLNSPRGLALNEDGDLLIAETGLNAIRRLTPAGVLTTIAGSGVIGFAGDGGPAIAAQLNSPVDVAVDSGGVVWIADSANNRIRALTPSVIGESVLSTAMVHAATLAPGPIAPGEIVTIFGVGFEPGHTQLLFDGKPATIFYAGTNQINALAPLDLAPNSSTQLSITVNGVRIADFPSAVVASWPGLFTLANGTGQAAATNQDGSLNADVNPAERGSIISLYGTGEGSDVSVVSLKIGGYSADLIYAGPAPGFPGLMQINARVPSGFLPPGIHLVVLSIGTAASQSGVTIAVR